jgi:hypothetical protein
MIMRGHGRMIMSIAVLAPVLAILALVAQFVPGGAEECTSTSAGASVCQSLPAVSAWGGPLPFVIAGSLILLSGAPLVSLRFGAWWVSAVSAALQSIPQVISFGGFIEWAPALLATVAVTFALLGSRPGTKRASPSMGPV